MSCEDNRHYLFSNGSQRMDWENANCCRCAKYSDDASKCDLMMKITFAAFGDGHVDGETARRLGLLAAREDGEVPYLWPCLELVPEGQ